MEGVEPEGDAIDPTEAGDPGTPELPAVEAFLAQHPPFAGLPERALREAAAALRVRYLRRGATVFPVGEANAHLFLIRSGAVELRDAGGALVERLGEGDSFGTPSLISGDPTTRSAQATEDTLLYLLPRDAFEGLRRREAAFAEGVSDALAQRLSRVTRRLRGVPPGEAGWPSGSEGAADTPVRMDLLATCRSLVRRTPVSGSPDLTIREAALQMSEAGVASLLLVAGGGALVGILTNRDLRTRVLAAGVDPGAPVRSVMTPDPITLDPEASRLDAVLLMVQHGIHHLPLVRGGRIEGVVSATDLLQGETLHPVVLADRIRKAPTLLRAVAVARERDRLFLNLVRRGAGPAEVERILTGVADALALRLLAARPDSGATWLVFGSQARREMGLHSDQDHGLLLPKRGGEGDAEGEAPADAEADAEGEADAGDGLAALPGPGRGTAAAAARLGRQVSHALDRAGYPRCPGEVMASEPRWRATGAEWEARFRRWTREPAMEELIHAGVLFDLRGLGPGEAAGEALREQMLGHTRGNEIFAAHMATVALRTPPPLGIFRRLVVERSGEETPVLELKRRGIQPLVDLVRVHALVAGVGDPGTRARLHRLAAEGHLSSAGAVDLGEVLDFLATLRQRWQAHRLEQGLPPDSRVALEALSQLERRHLKDAFQLLRSYQEHLGQSYQTGRVAT
jgi:CBS domain-containing protein